VDTKINFAQINEQNTIAYETIHNNPDKGLVLSRETFENSKSIDYKKGMADSKLIEGWCLLLKNNYNNSLEALEISLSAFKEIKDSHGEIKALNAFGVLYSNISNYETAMKYYTESLNLSQKTKDDERLVSAYINIGSLYTESGKIEESSDCYDKAIEILKKNKNKAQLCACLINIGENYQVQNKLDDALDKYNQSLKISREIKNKVYESNCLTSIGKIYQKKGDFEKSDIFHSKSLEIAESLGDMLSKSECLTNLAILYLNEGSFDKSIKYHEEALNLSKNIGSKYYMVQNYAGLTNTYEQKGVMQKAFDNFKLYHNAFSDLQNDEIDVKLQIMNAQYNIDASKKEAAEQRIRNKELKEAFERVSLLNKIGKDITSSLDMETVMTNIYMNLLSFISADLFGIALYYKDSDEVDFKYFLENGKRTKRYRKPLKREGSLISWVIINKKCLFFNDVHNEYIDYVPKLIGFNIKTTNSLIFVPLISGTDVIGVITFQSSKLNAYTKQHLEIIQAVGAYSSIALENSIAHEEINNLIKIINSEKKALQKAYQKIDSLANHDILTGLPNRRLFTELLKQEIKQADRKKSKTAVFFIDLDNFKTVNDTLGHDAGDKMLKMVSQRFISTLRESDTIARIGGDEFAAIICNVKKADDIKKIAEKIIGKFRNPFKVRESSFNIGISMGISLYPDDDKDIDSLLKKADRAMYEIKTNSKNSFILYADLI